MKLICTLLLSVFSNAAVQEPLSVVATTPDLADITRAIGGERVDVHTLVKGTQNIHKVRLRPSSLVKIDRADVLVEMGMNLEHAFLPGLLRAAKNKRIQPGAPGLVNCSAGWQPIEVPDTISRGQSADVHPEGNPHYNLHPGGGRHIATVVRDALIEVAPNGKPYFEERFNAYARQLDTAEARWKKLGVHLSGRKVVVYHTEFSYLAEATGLEVIGTVEPKAGVPPSPADLARVVETMKEEGVSVLLTASWSNGKSLRYVAEKSGARIVELPVMVGGAKGANTWIELMDLIFKRLAEAFPER